VSPWKVILATMVIFACGVMTGAMLTRTITPRAEPAPALAAQPTPARMSAPPLFQMQRTNFLKVLDKQLDLSAAQREQIGKIMKASQERTQPLWNQIAPQMSEEIKSVREEIRGVLTPEQRKKFVELLRRNRKPEAAPPGPNRPARPSETTTSATNAL
jgi:Spy/CpxP family protein refolding chaperone